MDRFSTWPIFDITQEEKRRRVEEIVRLRGTDGVVVEADVKAVVGYSGLLKSLIELFGIADIIDLPHRSSDVEWVVKWCESHYDVTMRQTERVDVSDGRASMPSFDVERVDVSDPLKLNDQEAFNLECFDRDIFVPNYFNKFCKLDCNWETIARLHEAADYMQIPSLLHFTSILIREAPSRAFMGVVSPWVDYDSLEAYRYRAEVAAF